MSLFNKLRDQSKSGQTSSTDEQSTDEQPTDQQPTGEVDDHRADDHRAHDQGAVEADSDDPGFVAVPPLRVKPAQREHDAVAPWMGEPPALAADFATAADGRVEIRAASLRGNSHQELGELRQDAFRVACDDTMIHVAVADGVGSQPLSHLGAARACETAISASQAGEDVDGIGRRVVDAIEAEASRLKCPPTHLSTTLCWARIQIGERTEAWPAEVAEWGDSEAVILDRSRLKDGHPRWLRIRKRQSEALNSARALPGSATPVAHVAATPALWRPEMVLGIFSDGVALHLEAESRLGHALANVWSTPPSIWDFVGHIAFRYAGANDDRTAVVLWRAGDATGHATASPGEASHGDSPPPPPGSPDHAGLDPSERHSR